MKKKCTFLSVNVFSTEVLTGDTISTSPTGVGTAISIWSYESREGPAVCSAKVVLSVLSYFKTPRPLALQSSALPTELVLLLGKSKKTLLAGYFHMNGHTLGLVVT